MRLLPFFFFSFITLVYLNNTTRDIYSGDIGDLVTAAFVFGIPHPPGYPLLTFLGSIFTHLPFPVPVVTKMAYVSVLSSIIGLVFFFTFSAIATKSKLIAYLSTLILAFSYPFWLQTEIPEVFALSHGLLILILFFAIKFYEEKKVRYFYLTLFFMGLSLTNQQAIIAVFPAVGLLLLGGLRLTSKVAGGLLRGGLIMVVLRGIGAFFLGILPYIYVPIAASTNPQINWLGESTIQNFIRLILRTAYESAYPFEENAVGIIPRFIALKIYSQYLIDHYSIIIVLLCLIGILALLKNKKLLLLSLVSGFIISGPLFIYVIFPPINDPEQFRVLERFYTHSFIVVLFLLPFGLHYILRAIQKLTRPALAKLFLLPVFIIPFVLFLQNFPRTNLSKTQIGNNLGQDILNQLPPNAAIFLKTDTVIFNTWYVHFVLGKREDIVLNVPRENKDVFLQEIFKKKRPIFFTHKEIIEHPQFVLIPDGLLLSLIQKDKMPSKEEFIRRINNQIGLINAPKRGSLTPPERNLLTPTITKFYSVALSRIGNFINLTYDDPEESIPFYERAIEIDHEDSLGYAGLGYAYFQHSRNCRLSKEMLKQAISLNPFYPSYYKQLYQMLKECNAKDEEFKAIKSKYKSLFKKDIEKEPFWRFQILSEN